MPRPTPGERELGSLQRALAKSQRQLESQERANATLRGRVDQLELDRANALADCVRWRDAAIRAAAASAEATELIVELNRARPMRVSVERALGKPMLDWQWKAVVGVLACENQLQLLPTLRGRV